ncbi:carbohydrate ABC transporter permease [Planomonospora parontospora]|uniref:carbohydrate ABC transporter permease n=1 Tax=Planomonospora parontospora TaxID=58119 RepID=UPI001671419D|nr:carbohydrate ABC transporter permease [Planomonospora parontospora]GGL17604.1 sugar ABC transporter permease [Planomonospora parontospora subsp. antibiotica]GII15228.1 sugar ABC transporter permease [Planomonospora parontospora subsp. antibiotica]
MSTAPATLGRAPASAARRPTARSLRRRRTLHWIAVHSIAIALAIMFVAPLVFIALTALMTDQQALTSQLWPRSWNWGNFTEVFARSPLLLWIGNTMLYAGLGTAFMLLSSVPVAYALARFRFPGRRAAFLAVITMMMLPPQVVAVPVYLIWARAELTGTLWPLVLPMLLGDAFSIFLLRQFLLTIPREYTEAARVDGCSDLATLLRIVLPMARPAIAAVALFQFFYCWNDYYGPLLYASTNVDNWTLSIGLASFKALHSVQWNLTMAATLLVMAPVIIVFFLAQRVFIEGVTLTGVKG